MCGRVAGFPGAVNDKTVSFLDGFMQSITTVPLFVLGQFVLHFTRASAKLLRGLYVICDNGYKKLRRYQCPIKFPCNDAECVFAARLESDSVRKGMPRSIETIPVHRVHGRLACSLWNLPDVECCFGIMKVLGCILLFFFILATYDIGCIPAAVTTEEVRYSQETAASPQGVPCRQRVSSLLHIVQCYPHV